MDAASVNQSSAAGKDRKKKAGIQPRTPAFMRAQSFQRPRLLQMKQTGAGEGRGSINDTVGTDRSGAAVAEQAFHLGDFPSFLVYICTDGFFSRLIIA